MKSVLRMLGSLEITVDGQEVHPGGPKQRALLCFLVLNAGQPVTNSTLIEAVWGPDAPDGAIRSLRTYVSSLRRLLGSTADLIGNQGTYRLIPRSLETDVDRFRTSVRGVRTQMQTDEGIAQLDHALALWRGPFLAGIDRPWVAAEAARLDHERRRAVAAWSEIAMEGGRHKDVIAELERAVSESPLDEQMSGLLMRALCGAGRQSDALAVYRDIRDRLASDLGISPGAELQSIEERIVLGHESMGHDPTHPGLPDPPTELVGRASEIEEILGLLGHTRLLTLTGPGGVGKTRLALEIGRRIVERDERPVFFTDLSALFDSTAVEAILAASARVQPHPDSGPLASLIEYLRPRDALLLVDNCEHLMSTVARSLAAIVRQCPAVTIIATSRAPLHIDGEVEWRTPPLALPDRPEPTLEALRRWPAIELVLRRAPSGFLPSSAHQVDLVAMCRSVDGLPLALEIAASRLGTMTPADVTRTLESRKSVAALKTIDGGRDALDATIAWSYELLPEGPRALLDRLGMMSGQFVFDDVLAVCGPPGSHADDVQAWLTLLVEHSLVLADTSDERTRYRLLETIRRFALRTLGADVEAVRHRHVEHYTALAEREAIRLLSRAEGDAVKELAMAHDNLRSAFRSSMETGDVGTASRIVSSLSDAAYWRSHIELSQWAEAAWNAATADDPSWNGVCGAAGRGAWMGGRFDDALRFAGAASHLRLAPMSQSGHADDVIADVALYRGNAESALAHYAAVASAAGQCGDLTREVWATYYVAVTNAVLGRLSAARDAARRALEGASETGNPTAIAFSLYATGLAIKHRSPEEAIGLFTEAVRTAESVRNDWFAGIAGMELAATMMLRGEAVEGMEALVEIIDVWHRFGDHTQLRLAWRYLVRGLVQVGLSEEAAVLSGALLADELSVLTHPHPSVLKDLELLLGDATYTRLTVRGLVMSTSELVDASLASIARARSLSHDV